MKAAKENGYADKVPCYSTIGVYMEKPELTPVIKELIKITSIALASVENDFTIDSSGFGTSRFVK